MLQFGGRQRSDLCGYRLDVHSDILDPQAQAIAALSKLSENGADKLLPHVLRHLDQKGWTPPNYSLELLHLVVTRPSAPTGLLLKEIALQIDSASSFSVAGANWSESEKASKRKKVLATLAGLIGKLEPGIEQWQGLVEVLAGKLLHLSATIDSTALLQEEDQILQCLEALSRNVESAEARVDIVSTTLEAGDDLAVAAQSHLSKSASRALLDAGRTSLLRAANKLSFAIDKLSSSSILSDRFILHLFGFLVTSHQPTQRVLIYEILLNCFLPIGRSETKLNVPEAPPSAPSSARESKVIDPCATSSSAVALVETTAEESSSLANSLPFHSLLNFKIAAVLQRWLVSVSPALQPKMSPVLSREQRQWFLHAVHKELVDENTNSACLIAVVLIMALNLAQDVVAQMSMQLPMVFSVLDWIDRRSELAKSQPLLQSTLCRTQKSISIYLLLLSRNLMQTSIAEWRHRGSELEEYLGQLGVKVANLGSMLPLTLTEPAGPLLELRSTEIRRVLCEGGSGPLEIRQALQATFAPEDLARILGTIARDAIFFREDSLRTSSVSEREGNREDGGSGRIVSLTRVLSDDSFHFGVVDVSTPRGIGADRGFVTSTSAAASPHLTAQPAPSGPEQEFKALTSTISQHSKRWQADLDRSLDGKGPAVELATRHIAESVELPNVVVPPAGKVDAEDETDEEDDEGGDEVGVTTAAVGVSELLEDSTSLRGPATLDLTLPEETLLDGIYKGSSLKAPQSMLQLQFPAIDVIDNLSHQEHYD